MKISLLLFLLGSSLYSTDLIRTWKLKSEPKKTFKFAHPYQSWQRGLNEHTNGLIREYFPKEKEFQEITNKQIVDVQNRLNNRPKKQNHKVWTV